VQSIQDIRAADASKRINLEMQKLTEQSVEENKLMKRLIEQSTRDTGSMMTIALISAIFLPATFLAVSVAQYHINKIEAELMIDIVRVQFLRIFGAGQYFDRRFEFLGLHHHHIWIFWWDCISLVRLETMQAAAT
jgi:hypothetical protein